MSMRHSPGRGSEEEGDSDTEDSAVDDVLAVAHDERVSARRERRVRRRRAESGEIRGTLRSTHNSFLPLFAVLLFLVSLYVVFGAIRLIRSVWTDVVWADYSLPKWTSDASVAEESAIRT